MHLGYHSRFTRFPNDGLAIAIFTNDDNAGPLLKEVLKFRIIDAAFGLDPVDWNSKVRIKSASLTKFLEHFEPGTRP